MEAVDWKQQLNLEQPCHNSIATYTYAKQSFTENLPRMTGQKQVKQYTTKEIILYRSNSQLTGSE